MKSIKEFPDGFFSYTVGPLDAVQWNEFYRFEFENNK
jgi:hypothetical protein